MQERITRHTHHLQMVRQEVLNSSTNWLQLSQMINKNTAHTNGNITAACRIAADI